MFGMVSVAQMILMGGIDALIGMDILGMGDFAVTHYGGENDIFILFPFAKRD
jgi:hypothetical protein